MAITSTIAAAMNSIYGELARREAGGQAWAWPCLHSGCETRSEEVEPTRVSEDRAAFLFLLTANRACLIRDSNSGPSLGPVAESMDTSAAGHQVLGSKLCSVHASSAGATQCTDDELIRDEMKVFYMFVRCE